MDSSAPALPSGPSTTASVDELHVAQVEAVCKHFAQRNGKLFGTVDANGVVKLTTSLVPGAAWPGELKVRFAYKNDYPRDLRPNLEESAVSRQPAAEEAFRVGPHIVERTDGRFTFKLFNRLDNKWIISAARAYICLAMFGLFLIIVGMLDFAEFDDSPAPRPSMIPGENRTSIGFRGFYDEGVPNLWVYDFKAPPICTSAFTSRECFPLPPNAASTQLSPSIDLNASDILYAVCNLADKHFYDQRKFYDPASNYFLPNSYSGGTFGLCLFLFLSIFPCVALGMATCSLAISRTCLSAITRFHQKKNADPQIILSRLLVAFAPQFMISYRWGGLDERESTNAPIAPRCSKRHVTPPKHDAFVKFLADLLPDVWIDKEQIGVGDRLSDILPAMVANAQYAILILEPGYFTRPNCVREFIAALRWRDELTRPTVALLRPRDWVTVGPKDLSMEDVTHALSQFGVEIVDSETNLLKWIDKHCFNADHDKQERLFAWWARYGSPLPTSKTFLGNPNLPPPVDNLCLCPPILCCRNNLSYARRPIVTTRMEQMKMESGMRRLLCRSLWRILRDFNNTRSPDDLFVGHVFLSRDGRFLTDEFHAHPSLISIVPQILGLFFHVLLAGLVAVDLRVYEKSASVLIISICLIVWMLSFSAVYVSVIIGVIVDKHSFYSHHSALSPLVAASCLTNMGSTSADVNDATALMISASSAAVSPLPTVAVATTKSNSTCLAPHQKLRTALPFGGTLQIVLVSETLAALETAAKIEPDVFVDDENRPQINVTFEHAVIDKVLNNLVGFLGDKAVGLDVKRVSFEDLLSTQSPSIDERFLRVYVFFLRSSAALNKFHSEVRSQPNKWPTDKVIAVLPSFEFVSSKCPELLDVMSVLTGPSGCDKADAPIRGISNCVIAALADAVPRLLLSQHARQRV